MVKRIDRGKEYLAVIRNKETPSDVAIVTVIHSDQMEVKRQHEEDKQFRFNNVSNRLPWYECDKVIERGDVICRRVSAYGMPAFIVNRRDLFELWEAALILDRAH